MMAKAGRAGGGYYGECEGSGSSGRIDVDVSEDSTAINGKCCNLYTDTFGLNVHVQAYPCSAMSAFERKDLAARLKVELQEVRNFQKKVQVVKANGSAVSSTSDILSGGYRQNGQLEMLHKPSMMKPKSGKKSDGLMKKGCNRGVTGRFHSAGGAPAMSNAAASVALMKKCESILKRLMAHQYGWVFKAPVDVVKLNIPDYFTIIKHPMDLGTVKKKLSAGLYPSPLEFFDDVKLTFSNAMTYNPPGNDVHIMADTLNKLFETQSKDIKKKLQPMVPNPAVNKPLIQEENSAGKALPPSKKRKVSPEQRKIFSEPVVERIMSEEEKHKLGLELEAILEDMPISISDFLRQQSSSGIETGEDEIEIEIDALSDDTLFTLRKLLDDHLKQNNLSKAEPCELELFNESGLSSSSMQPLKGNEPVEEDIDVGENEPPVSSYPPLEIEKDVEHRGCNCITPNSINESSSGMDHVAQTEEQKPCPVNSDGNQEGGDISIDRQMSPDKLYRAALLKNRFADTILKAREKTLKEDEKDPEKLQKEKEELEMQLKKEKSRLQAEAKAAEDAKKKAEEEAAAEAKRKRDIEREAARQALLEMEKTVEINENDRILKDLEMMKVSQSELPSSVGVTSPENVDDGMGGLTFGGNNPLEQLGLFMKQDDEEEELNETSMVAYAIEGAVDDTEEGELA